MIKLSSVSGEGPAFGKAAESIKKAIKEGIKITREELIEELASPELQREQDEGHKVADLLILQYLGDIEIFKLWDKLEKWFT